MKIKIFNNGNGWFFPIGNYKDKNEKPIFVNVRFPQNYCPEPSFTPDQNNKCNKTIFINEGSFSKYINDKGELKIILTVFMYELLTDINLQKEDPTMFGNTNNVIDSKDLPFY